MSIIVASNKQVLDQLVKNREALIKAGIYIDDFITHYTEQVQQEVKEQKKKRAPRTKQRGIGKKTIVRIDKEEKRNEFFRVNKAGI